MSFHSSLLRAFLAVLALAAPARSQCLTPDNLDGGPCCGFTQAVLPTLPNFVQNTQSICWQDCGIDSITPVVARWKKLNLAQPGQVPPCGEERMRLDILDGANQLLWRGNMRLVYSRTFWVVDTNGLARQVWRYLVHGDLKNFPLAGSPPCPVPPCAPSFGNATYYSGYIDFAQDCSIPGGAFEMAWMLTHACDAIDHHASSPRAGAFHPDRAYTFVGPDAGFVANPIQPIEGTAAGGFEFLRQRVRTTAPTTILCTYEEPTQHTLTLQNLLCVCGLPGTQWMLGDLVAQTACGNAARTPVIGPILPGYLSMGIGAWTNPNVYPGQQALRWNVAGYDVTDVCSSSNPHLVYYGATTIGGMQAFEMTQSGPGNPLPPIFIDQGSSQRPNGLPTMGQPHQSYHLLGLNH